MSTSTTKQKIGIIAGVALILSALMLTMSYTGMVSAQSTNPVFLVRSNSVQSTYPSTNAFSVGTSTPVGTPQVQIGKLSVTQGVAEQWRKLFQVASTTGTGVATTTRDVFSITRAGCINAIATSSETQVKLVFLAVATTSSNGFVTWAFGSCSS